MTLRPWFEEYPERLGHELQALNALGLQCVMDETARAHHIIRLQLLVPASVTGSEELNLVAIYPDGFPYYRPEVFAEDLDLPRHQNPFAKNLCLLGRSTIEWDVDWTLADLLQKQLPRVLTAGRVTETDILAAQPGEQAEPFTDYYVYQPGTSIILDSRGAIPKDVSRGRFVLGIDGESTTNIRGAVLGVRSETGAPIWSASPELRTRFPRRHGFRWVRLERPLPYGGPCTELKEWLHTEQQWLLAEQGEWKPVTRGHVHVAGFVFPSEQQAPGRFDDAWLFLVLARRVNSNRIHWYFARSSFYDSTHLFARVPDLASLRTVTASVVGLGCIGAPIALEMARAGVGRLRLMDGDAVDPATTVRWPLGLSAAGYNKAQILREFVERDYPFTTATAFDWRLGQIRNIPVAPSNNTEWEALTELTENTDILIDATAEHGVHHQLSDIARALRIPYVAVTGSVGGWGGSICRIAPGRTEGCWMCLQYWMRDGEIPEPSAPPDGSGIIQPPGCADPTFTGASFDLVQVALAGARLAVASLSKQHNGGYPDPDWDVATVSLRAPDGSSVAPRWTTTHIRRHPDCPVCGGR